MLESRIGYFCPSNQGCFNPLEVNGSEWKSMEVNDSHMEENRSFLVTLHFMYVPSGVGSNPRNAGFAKEFILVLPGLLQH